MRRRKYSVELIISIVKERIEKGISRKALADRYNIPHRTIEEWVTQYKENGVSAFIQEEHNRVYSEETKLHAVEDYRKAAWEQGSRFRRHIRPVCNSWKSGYPQFVQKNTEPTTILCLLYPETLSLRLFLCKRRGATSYDLVRSF